MMDRHQVEALLKEVYAARKHGDLNALRGYFADDPTFVMAGAREASPIAVQCSDGETFRVVLDAMIKTFLWVDHQILAMVIEGANAAVHWRGRIRSTVTGDEVVTELVDLITIRDGKIQTLTEFCDTALAAKLMGVEAGRAEPAMV